MAEKVLFVDDEPNVLQSIRRSLRTRFDLDIAEGGEEALQLLRTDSAYAVIVSDMRMPGMNGVELLAQAKAEAPDTVRIMLTGNADQETAVEAVNKGDVFRFLNKPCDADQLAYAVDGAMRQHQLITAEKTLLENTLRGSIKALSDVLALTNPEVFGRATRFKNRIRRLAKKMQLSDLWQLESVALLSQIGCVTISQDLVKRRSGGYRLDDDELSDFAVHATAGADILATIPRMEEIAESIRYQEKNFNGTGYPGDSVKGADIPLGARLMKVVLDFDALESSGFTATEALFELKERSANYDPAVLSAFEESLRTDSSLTMTTVSISRLTDNMILAEDVYTDNGVLLVAKGQEATLSVRRHLQSFQSNGSIGASVGVLTEAS